MLPARFALIGLFAFTAVVNGCQAEPDQAETEGETGEASSEITICPDEVVRGIDVSYYQGNIDWAEVAGAGYQFAIARINHGDFMDPEFDDNWAGIKSVGMIRGAYQYFDPGGDVSWQAQVVIDKLGKIAPGDLPAVIDVESTDGLPPAQVAQAVGEWLALVEEGTGKKPIIYTGKYFWQDNVQTDEFNDHKLWHAQYPNACQPPAAPPDCGSCANIADQWDDIFVWQYSSSGSVPGIAGNVDMNVYFGTYEELLAFASEGGYAAELVSVDVPATVLRGESFTARVTVRNSGSSPFDASTLLGTTEPRDRDSAFYDASWPAENRPAAVGSSVAPGAEHTFEFAMRAPAVAGTYQEHFGIVQEGIGWFGNQGGPPDDAIELIVQVVDAPSGPAAGAGGGDLGGGGAGGEDGADGEPEGCDCRGAGSAGGSDGYGALGLALLGAAVGARRKRQKARARG
jgi:lysozyme